MSLKHLLRTWSFQLLQAILMMRLNHKVCIFVLSFNLHWYSPRSLTVTYPRYCLFIWYFSNIHHILFCNVSWFDMKCMIIIHLLQRSVLQIMAQILEGLLSSINWLFKSVDYNKRKISASCYCAQSLLDVSYCTR